MTSRRKKLINQVIESSPIDQSTDALDAVVKLVLGDMGQFYYEFHKVDGPGVLVLQPTSGEASMFYMPIGALHDWREDYPEGAKEIQKIIEAALKINPKEQAGYLIVDQEGFRFSVIDYNKTTDAKICDA